MTSALIFLICVIDVIAFSLIVKWKINEGFPDENDLKIEEEIHRKRRTSFLMDYTGSPLHME